MTTPKIPAARFRAPGTLSVKIDEAIAKTTERIRSIDSRDIASYFEACPEILEARSQISDPRPRPEFLDLPIPSHLRGSADSPDALQSTLGSIADTLDGVLGGKKLEEDDLLPLLGAEARMREILHLEDAKVFDLVAPLVKRRLQMGLFRPLERLVAIAERHRTRLVEKIDHVDRPRLVAAMTSIAAMTGVAVSEVPSVSLDEELVRNPAFLFDPSRYERGDWVAFSSDAGPRIGIVVDRKDEGEGVLRVELVSPETGKTEIRWFDRTMLCASGSMKLGEEFTDVAGRRIRVELPPRDGFLQGTATLPDGTVERVDPRAIGAMVSERLVSVLRTRFEEKLGRAKAAGAEHAVAIVGGAESSAIETFDAGPLRIAVFTTRGGRSYQEDGLLALWFPGGEFGVFGGMDQAGGCGKIPGWTGAANQVAGEALVELAIQIADERDAPPDRVESLVRDAIVNANQHVRELQRVFSRDPITTISTVVVKDGVAHLALVGDSPIYLEDPDGSLSMPLLPHNLGVEIAERIPTKREAEQRAWMFEAVEHSNIVTQALGCSDDPPALRYLRVPLAPGQRILIASDGLSDGNLERQYQALIGNPEASWPDPARFHLAQTNLELARVLPEYETADDMVRAAAFYAFDQMDRGFGVRDNLLLVGIQAR